MSPGNGWPLANGELKKKMTANLMRQNKKVMNSDMTTNRRGLFFWVLFFAAALGCRAERDSSLLIIGGEALGTSHIGHSNVVGLSESSESSGPESMPSCTGFLVGRSWVVTAAHCVAPGRLKYIYFQNDESKIDPQWRKIEKIIIHPDWKAEGLFDLAVVSFTPESDDMNGIPAGFGAAQVVDEAVWRASAASQVMDIVGYGAQSFPVVNRPQKLHAEVSVSKYWNDYFMGPGLITYDDPQKKGACYGDSGGPAYVKDANGKSYAVGITQGARGRYFKQMEKVDCSDGKGVYTWLTPFKSWIEQSISGQLSSGYQWGVADPSFRDLVSFCKAEKKRDIWNSFFALSLALEDKTQIPLWGCEALSRAASDVSELELNPWSKYAATGELLKFFTNLQRLKITDENGGFSPDVNLKDISQLSRLMVLSVEGPSLANAGELAKLTSLTNLDLFGTTEVDISLIQPLKKLTVLSIAGAAASDLYALGQITSLQKLNTRRCVLDEKSIDGLVDIATFYNLKSADFSRCAVDLHYLAQKFEKFKKFKPGTEFKFQKSLSVENSKIENRIEKNAFGLKITFR